MKLKIEDITLNDLENELERTKKVMVSLATIKEISLTLILIVASGLILSFLKFPLVKLETEAMSPNYNIGDVLLLTKTTKIKQNDIIVYYVGNNLLIGKVIGLPGDQLTITDDGDIYLNNELTNYGNKETKMGEINYPKEIGEKEYFVLNDLRSNLLDSRAKEIGNVKENQLLGKLVFCLWKGED